MRDGPIAPLSPLEGRSNQASDRTGRARPLQPHTQRGRFRRRNSSSTPWWNDVPRGTMDEVSSYVGLDLRFV